MAALLEMLGHVSTALLLYVLTVPEARCALLVIRDHRHQGLNNRFHIGRPGRLGQFRWIDVHHRRFKGVKVQDTLWQRMLGLASLEVSYLDEHGHQCHTVLHGIGTKQEVTVVTAYLAGEFRVRDQYVPPPTSRSGDGAARTHAAPEQPVSIDLIR